MRHPASHRRYFFIGLAQRRARKRRARSAEPREREPHRKHAGRMVLAMIEAPEADGRLAAGDAVVDCNGRIAGMFASER